MRISSAFCRPGRRRACTFSPVSYTHLDVYKRQEEYIEFLIAHPHICVYEYGALKYEIVRIKIADDSQSLQPVS